MTIELENVFLEDNKEVPINVHLYFTFEDTLSHLRYGHRVKLYRNMPLTELLEGLKSMVAALEKLEEDNPK